MLAEIDMG
jgi:hypothetical protein